MYDECADGSEVSQPDIAITCDPKDSFPLGGPLLIRRSEVKLEADIYG